MKFTTQTEAEYKTHTIATITVAIPVANDEEIALDAPMRDGDYWRASIDVASKSIKDWPVGTYLSISAWVGDSGSYQLLNDKNEIIAEIIENYVPIHLFAGSYADCLELYIDEYGTITNWLKDANFSDFQPEEITD